ncbi:Hypothetical protein POVR1_LOCUS342 [uncultured virus]|nr:Hypothetical protein POVR1_LOCUS342 [uncultured virus]
MDQLPDDLFVNFHPSVIVSLVQASKEYRQRLTKNITSLSQHFGWSSETVGDFIGIYYTKVLTRHCGKHFHRLKCLTWAIESGWSKLAVQYFNQLKSTDRGWANLIMRAAIGTLDKSTIESWYQLSKSNNLSHVVHALQMGGIDLYSFYVKLTSLHGAWGDLLPAVITHADFHQIKEMFSCFPKLIIQIDGINCYKHLSPTELMRLKILTLESSDAIAKYLNNTFFQDVGWIDGEFGINGITFHSQSLTINNLSVLVYLALHGNPQKTEEHLHSILDLRTRESATTLRLGKILGRLLSGNQSNELLFYQSIMKKLQPADEPIIIRVVIASGNVNVLNYLISFYQKSPYEIDEMYKTYGKMIIQHPGIYQFFRRHGYDQDLYHPQLIKV